MSSHLDFSVVPVAARTSWAARTRRNVSFESVSLGNWRVPCGDFAQWSSATLFL